MYRSETVARGWVLVKVIETDPAASFHVTTIPWRLWLTEYQVFGIRDTGETMPVGDRPVFTYR